MTEWKEYKLGEITTEIGDGIHGTPNYSETGDYYFINGNNIVNGKVVIKSDTKKIDSEQFQKYRKPLSDRTILLSINGTIGSVGYYNNEKCILGKSACYLNIKDTVDKHFVYYVFLSDDFQNHLQNIATGTTIQNVPLKGLRESIISLPPLDEQRRIASILSSLDGKIDLLQRENATLEQMAETMFRQWFVVERKEEWEEGKLGDLIDVKYGKDHKKLLDGKIPVIGSGGVMRYADTALYSKESVLIPRKGSLNNVMYINEPFWTVDTMFYTEMRRPNIAKFVYHLMKDQDLANMNVGSAVPSMTTEVLNNIPIDIPPQEVFDKFENAVVSLYNKKEQNNKQIITLTETRDGLLGRLMSGEIKL